MDFFHFFHYKEPFVLGLNHQCQYRTFTFKVCSVNITVFYSVYSFLPFLITGQTLELFSLKSIMFSREPVVFCPVLDAHVAGNSFIAQFVTAALKSPHEIRSESKTKL